MENKIKNCVDEIGECSEEHCLDFMSKKELAPIDRVNFMKNRIDEELEKERQRIKEIIENYFESSDLYFKMVNGLMTSCNTDIQDEIIAEIDNHSPQMNSESPKGVFSADTNNQEKKE